MQRFSFRMFFLAALYVSTGAYATQDLPTAAALGVGTTSNTNLPNAQALPVAGVENSAPHIALLLPLKAKSAALAHAANIVQQGFSAAAAVQQGLPVRIYSSTDETKDVTTLYRQAVANGAMAVAGPLTRDGVNLLSQYPNITVPTVVLNNTDTPKEMHKLFFFGLPAENEARQLALLASTAKLKNATIISTGSILSKRLALAFADEWKHQGGSITAEVAFTGDFDSLKDLPVAPWPEGSEPMPVSAVSANGEPIVSDRPLPPPIAPGNMVFLATEHDKARLIRPYLNPTLPIYATSQVFKGNTNKQLVNYDLNEVRFVDMPWLLQPDHPAVMIYPHSATPLSPDEDRLYALGIDTYRLIHILLTNRIDGALPLDGVTGRISLKGQQFQREPVAAFFKQGLGLTSEALAELNAAKAAAKAAAKQAENENGAPSQGK